MSPYFVPVFGFLISLVVGNVVSLATMGNKNRYVNPNLVNLRICYYLEKLLPKSWRRLQDHIPDRLNNTSTDKACNGNNFEIIRTDTYFLEDEQEVKETELALKSSQLSLDKTTSV